MLACNFYPLLGIADSRKKFWSVGECGKIASVNFIILCNSLFLPLFLFYSKVFRRALNH